MPGNFPLSDNIFQKIWTESRMFGEVVKIVFLLELAGLEGRKKLQKYDVQTVISYPGK